MLIVKDLSVIILAAGQGKRMKSHIPKVLHKVCGRTMLSYILGLISSCNLKDIIVVVGYKEGLIKNLLSNDIKIIKQKKLLGTASAVKSAKKSASYRNNILIIYGDSTLLRKQTLEKLIKRHFSSGASATLLTAHLDNPMGYGRIIRDEKNNVCRIGEEKDVSKAYKTIKEVNAGVYCFKRNDLFKALDRIKKNNKKKEYYLTDAIEILANSDCKIETVRIRDNNEIPGINSKQDLAKANQIMRFRILDEFMSHGVTIIDPSTTHIDRDVKIGQDTIIQPYTIIESNVSIGRDCSIGPFCHLRENTTIKNNAKIGNFVEVVRSTIDQNTLAKHFSYLGDVSIGKRVNIGAGTVIANFNGKEKNKTIIKDNAFIGSDTVLIAPVKVGRFSTTGAGSVVAKNRNIPNNTIVAGVPARKILKGRKNG